jgi:nucleotide-binding universal stress UspA family protein
MEGDAMMILHPTDFSECATQAEKLAVRLARDSQGELVLAQVLVETPLYGEGLLNVREAQKVYDAQRKWAEETLEARAGQIRREHGIKVRWTLPVGVPFEEIVRVAADEHADMIVMGTHGRSGLNRLLLGSVAERVIRLAPCPVVTVRQKEAAAA